MISESELPGNTVKPKLKICLVGAGLRTTSFMSYFTQNTSDGELIGISDIVPAKAKLLVEHFKSNAEVFDDTAKMLKTLKPDAIIICTPDYAHVESAITALQMKIHVLCEKPMATTLKDCDAIIEAAKKSSAIFYLGFNLRHSPFHDTIHQIINQGRLGKVTTIEANEYYYGGKTYFRRWNRLEKFGGGLWITKSCHDFDQLNWMAGGQPKAVFAVSSLSHYKPLAKAAKQCRNCSLQYECPDYYDIFQVCQNSGEEIFRQLRLTSEQNGKEPGDLCLFNSDKDTFDNGTVIVTYENDIRTSYTVNVLSALSTRQMRIVGTEATLIGDMENGTIEITERHTARKYTYDLKSLMACGHGGADDRMVKDFLHTIYTGKKPKSSWAEGRLAVQVALAARQSSNTGKVVNLD
jgi:predicted dehydrogenase